jgi:threonine dehydrogenase-like Zn-dependent dehydrogenase
MEITSSKADPSAVATHDSMLAAVFVGPQQVRVEPVALPLPGPGQIRVRMQGCGLCASNLGPWLGGPWMTYPLEPGAPGHEGWGIVEALGEGVRSHLPGQRVTLFSQHAYAQYDIVEAQAALPLPAQLDRQPFPGEPLGCAMNIFKRSRIEPGQTVTVIGIGFLGALLTRLCSEQGARVIAVSRRPFALQTARRCGAQAVVSTDDPWPAARIMELTSGKGCERVIEAVGMQWALDLAGEITAVRGRLVVAGYHQDGPRQVNMQQWNWRGIDVINAHERETETYLQGIGAAIEAVRNGRIDLSALCTHSFALEDLPEAFNALQQRPEGFLKAWIRL